jgi:hypothetical protein
MEIRSLKRRWLYGRLLYVLLFTLIGFAVMGYHPGLEDDGIYLTAVKARLNPSACNCKLLSLTMSSPDSFG